MAARLRGRAFIAMLGLTAVSAVVFWTLAPPTYLTNDDVAIRRDLEGLMAPDGMPTGYAIWPHALLGWALVYVQRVVPVHTWDLVIAALIICAAALALGEAWSMSREPRGRLLSTLAALVVIIPLFSGMQYTMSATLAAVAAVFALVMELWSGPPRRLVLAAAATLLVSALLVRSDSAIAAGVLTIVLLVPYALSSADTRSARLRGLAGAAVVLAVAAIALDLTNDAMYRLSPAWAAYRADWLATRRLLEWGSDLPDHVVSMLRARVGWSENDWELLRRFWGVDPAIHSQARLDSVFAAWPQVVNPRMRALLLTQRAVVNVMGGAFLHLFAESWLTLVAAAAVVLGTAGRRGIATATATVVIFYVACVALEVVFKELPFRLFAPLQVALIMAVLSTSCVSSSRSRPRLTTTIAAAILAALLGIQASRVRADAAANTMQAYEVDAQVTDVLKLRPSLLVLHGDSFPSEFWWRPFHTPAVRLPAIELGNENHHPYIQRFLEASYQPSLLHAICTDPSILVVSEHDRLAPITAYMREHYATHVTWMNVYQGSFGVWRCARTEEK